MNNTIHNVPRELLERAAYTLELAYEVDTPTVRDIRALLSAPSPAGVDGLEVVAEVVWYDPELHGQTGDGCKIVDYSSSDLERIPVGGKLYALPIDAQAIIDGLRGEVEELRAESFESLYNAVIDERDQQAKRIGELEGLLRELFNDYKRLADSGDAGNWKLEETNVGSKVLAALSDLQPLAKSALPTERSGQIRSTPR